jgi:hypothetical protein
MDEYILIAIVRPNEAEASLSIPTSAASATSARNPFTASSTPVHEDLPRQKIPQRRYAFFLEQSLLFPRR